MLEEFSTLNEDARPWLAKQKRSERQVHLKHPGSTEQDHVNHSETCVIKFLAMLAQPVPLSAPARCVRKNVKLEGRQFSDNSATVFGRGRCAYRQVGRVRRRKKERKKATSITGVFPPPLSLSLRLSAPACGAMLAVVCVCVCVCV